MEGSKELNTQVIAYCEGCGREIRKATKSSIRRKNQGTPY